MKDLEEEQRKMRERMRASRATRKPPERKPQLKSSETKDVQALLTRIMALETENASLRRQLSMLRSQPIQQERPHEMSENERRYLFMKYSNVRRY